MVCSVDKPRDIKVSEMSHLRRTLSCVYHLDVKLKEAESRKMVAKAEIGENEELLSNGYKVSAKQDE